MRKDFDFTTLSPEAARVDCLAQEMRTHHRNIEGRMERIENDIADIKQALVFIGMRGVGGVQ